MTTLTKRMAEDLTEYYRELGVKVEYLHSDVETLERVKILRELRKGTFDVLVGVNLLREGLDLPEVSLVAVLDADKEGFLRSEGSLIQTMGRAARNVNGKAILYADKQTDSMRAAMDETARRRKVQEAYNAEHGITPETISRALDDLLASPVGADYSTVPLDEEESEEIFEDHEALIAEIARLSKAMHAAAARLDFRGRGGPPRPHPLPRDQGRARVRGFWHPVSAVYLDRPRDPGLARRAAPADGGEGRVEVVYAGDRMWPAIRHGETLVVAPVAESAPVDGDVVLTVDEGIPDVMRMAAAGGAVTRHGGCRSRAAARGDGRRPARDGSSGRLGDGALRRSMARTWLDLREAAAGPDPGDDPAQTVRQKYDDQAGALRSPRGRRRSIPVSPPASSSACAPAPRVLVAGSGAGREAFELERLGYAVTGVDFSPRMVEAARAEASRRGSAATFTAADLRSHDEPARLARRGRLHVRRLQLRARVSAIARRSLSALSGWLAEGGAVFLSARRTQRVWDHAVLWIQWLVRGACASALALGRLAHALARRFGKPTALVRPRLHRPRSRPRGRRAANLRRVSWEAGHGLFVQAFRSQPPGARMRESWSSKGGRSYPVRLGTPPPFEFFARAEASGRPFAMRL